MEKPNNKKENNNPSIKVITKEGINVKIIINEKRFKKLLWDMHLLDKKDDIYEILIKP